MSPKPKQHVKPSQTASAKRNSCRKTKLTKYDVQLGMHHYVQHSYSTVCYCMALFKIILHVYVFWVLAEMTCASHNTVVLNGRIEDNGQNLLLIQTDCMQWQYNDTQSGMTNVSLLLVVTAIVLLLCYMGIICLWQGVQDL